MDAVRPSDSPVHSEMEQLHSLSKQRKLRSKRKGEATSGLPKVSCYCFILVDLLEFVHSASVISASERNAVVS